MNANLLTDAVFGTRTPNGDHRRLSLPGLLAGLGAGSVESLTGVQRHQADAFHMFLCYLGAAALDHSGTNEPSQDEDFWRQALRDLTAEGDDCAWMLVVEDPGKPAFMQPPTDDGQLSGYKPKATTPDELDVLQTAKNHDLKAARLSGATAEDWALALISLQTMSGYAGRDTYGISRMNGGYGSRVCVAVNRDLQPSARWSEDTVRLMPRASALTTPPWPYRPDGHRLLWILPWDGRSALPLDTLHPFYSEVCRLIRLVNSDGALQALGRPTKTARIAAPKTLAGNMGDAWTPVRRRDNAALTPSERGFHAELLRDLLITRCDYEPAPMQTLPEGHGPAVFHASVLVRGQGTTAGFHEAHVHIDANTKRLLLLGGEPVDRLGRLSEWGVTAARDLRTRVLRPALFALFEGGPEGWPDTGRREAGQWSEHWLKDFDRRWSDEYFPWLWHAVELDNPGARSDWLKRLRHLAEAGLENAVHAAPQRTGRRYRARVRASGLFHNVLRKHYREEIEYDAG